MKPTTSVIIATLMFALAAAPAADVLVAGKVKQETGTGIALLAPSDVSFLTQPASRRVLPNDTVTLSAIVEPPTAQFQWFKNGTAIAGATSNAFATSALTTNDNGATYYLVASDGGTSVQSSNAVITVGKLVPVQGARQEYWTQDTLGGTADRTIVEDPSFSTPPDSVANFPAFETPNNVADNYVNRLSGLFVAPVTGDYVFFVASDDDSDLFLSTDATPALKRQIAAEVDSSSVRNWTGNDGGTAAHQLEQKRSDKWVPDPTAPPPEPPFASGIHLLAGTQYYLEAVHHEGDGDDNLAATYILKGEPDPQPGDATRIVWSVLGPYAQVLDGGAITIAEPPQNTTAVQSSTATLSINATSSYIGDTSGASPGLYYQWQAAAGSSSFTNILNATAASYTTPVLKLTDSGTLYRVALLAGDAGTNSSTATLTVSPDTTPPAPYQVTAVDASFKVVNASMNELMERASAETAANYSFSPGNIAVSTASLDATGTNLTLTAASALSPNTETTLTANGAKDLAGNPANKAALTFSFKPVTYAENILFDQPLGYYRFEETSGAVAKNSGGMGGDGAYYTGDEAFPGAGGTPSTAKGDPGPRPPAFAGFDANNHSATFDGIGEWVDTKNQFLQDRAAFTLEYWLNPTGGRTDSPSQWVNHVGIVGQNDAIEYGLVDPLTVEIWTLNGGSLNTSYPYPDDEWHHVATIADGSLLKTYYDGVLQGSAGNTTADYGSSIYNVHIGGGGIFDDAANWFTGHIDEVAIFDKAIPAERVAAHYKAGKSGGVLVTSGTGPGGGDGTNILLSVSRSGVNLTIAWTPTGGTLQSATALTGKASDWTDAGAANPTTVAIGTGNRFYRVKAQ